MLRFLFYLTPNRTPPILPRIRGLDGHILSIRMESNLSSPYSPYVFSDSMIEVQLSKAHVVCPFFLFPALRLGPGIVKSRAFLDHAEVVMRSRCPARTIAAAVCETTPSSREDNICLRSFIGRSSHILTEQA